MKIAIIALLLVLTGCTRPDEARRVLDSNGYTNIQIGGFAAWMCGRDDSFATKFVAKSPNGKTVSGAVCSAWGRGATIRFD